MIENDDLPFSKIVIFQFAKLKNRKVTGNIIVNWWNIAKTC